MEGKNFDAADFITADTKNGLELSRYAGSEKTVSIPDGIRVIGEKAFMQNENLEEIRFPESVRVVEAEAFTGCGNLERIFFSEGMERIMTRSFSFCRKITELEFPESLQYIGGRAFEFCSSLKRIKIKSRATRTAEHSFRGTPYFEEAMVRVNALSRSSSSRLAGSKAAKAGYEDLYIPEGVRNIDTWEFSGAPVRTVSLPSSLATVGECAFRGCTGLVRVEMSPNTRYNTVRGPGGDIFADCSSLEEVVLRGPLLAGGDAAGTGEHKNVLLQNFDRRRTFANCNRMKRIIAWDIPLEFFPDEWLRYAVDGYLGDMERNWHYAPEIASGYDEFTQKISVPLLKKAARSYDPALIHYLTEKDMIPENELDRLIENRNRREGAYAAGPEAIAMLLRYREKKRNGKSFLDFLTE